MRFSWANSPALASLLVLVGISMIGCNPQPSVYLPTSPQVPLLTKQGEFRVAVATNAENNSTTEFDNFSSLEAAYALSDDIGIIANASYSPQNLDSNNVGFLYGEVGTGYYKKLNDFGAGDWAGSIVTEAYGGVGFGQLHSRNLKDDNTYGGDFGIIDASDFTQKNASFVRPFVQASIGAEGSIFAIALSVRASYLIMNHIQTDSLTIGQNEFGNNISTDTIYTIKNSKLFIEPAFVMRAGYDPVKLELKLWFSEPIGQPPPFLWGETNISLGISFDLKP